MPNRGIFNAWGINVAPPLACARGGVGKMSILSWFRNGLRTRRRRQRALALVELGLGYDEAVQLAEVVDWLREDSGSLAEAIGSSDALCIRLSVGNCVTHAHLTRELADKVDRALCSSELSSAIGPN